MVIFSLLSTSAIPSPSPHLQTSLAPSRGMANGLADQLFVSRDEL
jgi:hypothetical protein